MSVDGDSSDGEDDRNIPALLRNKAALLDKAAKLAAAGWLYPRVYNPKPPTTGGHHNILASASTGMAKPEGASKCATAAPAPAPAAAAAAVPAGAAPSHMQDSVPLLGMAFAQQLHTVEAQVGAATDKDGQQPSQQQQQQQEREEKEEDEGKQDQLDQRQHVDQQPEQPPAQQLQAPATAEQQQQPLQQPTKSVLRDAVVPPRECRTVMHNTVTAMQTDIPQLAPPVSEQTQPVPSAHSPSQTCAQINSQAQEPAQTDEQPDQQLATTQALVQPLQLPEQHLPEPEQPLELEVAKQQGTSLPPQDTALADHHQQQQQQQQQQPLRAEGAEQQEAPALFSVLPGEVVWVLPSHPNKDWPTWPAVVITREEADDYHVKGANRKALQLHVQYFGKRVPKLDEYVRARVAAKSVVPLEEGVAAGLFGAGLDSSEHGREYAIGLAELQAYLQVSAWLGCGTWCLSADVAGLMGAGMLELRSIAMP